jgi:hypothetical protein
MNNLDQLAALLIDRETTDRETESLCHCNTEEMALESHLAALRERLLEVQRFGGPARAGADTRLQLARTLVALRRGHEAWPFGRMAFDEFLVIDDFESAADACDVLFQARQPGSLSALGQGIWLAVTCPIDPELSVELLGHVIEETPDGPDGAAVAASTALFLADVRAQGRDRDELMFFSTQTLGEVARRQAGVKTPEQFDRWLEQLELKEPGKFLARLRQVVEGMIGGDWWFDPVALCDRLPCNGLAGQSINADPPDPLSQPAANSQPFDWR